MISIIEFNKILERRSAKTILCDHNILLRLKEIFCRNRIAIRVLYMVWNAGYKEISLAEECGKDEHASIDV